MNYLIQVTDTGSTRIVIDGNVLKKQIVNLLHQVMELDQLKLWPVLNIINLLFP